MQLLKCSGFIGVIVAHRPLQLIGELRGFHMKHCNKTNFIFSKFQARDSSESATESHGTSDRSEGQSRDRTSSGGTQDSSNKEHRYRKAF